MQSPPSLWWSDRNAGTPRASLQGDVDVDVAIVGAGFTGLWTARELLRRDPSLRVAIIEKHSVGFGASGRNGGWVSALFPVSDDTMVARHGADAVTHQRQYLRDSVAAFGASLADDGIEGDFAHGGTFTFARNQAQLARLRAATGDGTSWVDVEELRTRAWVDGALGATFSPHCARIHPGQVVDGLARRLRDLGVTIYEDSPVTRIVERSQKHAAHVVTPSGTVSARYVVRATEGFTPTLPGQRRTVAPIYSLMIATAPLSDQFWTQYGFATMPTFADERNLIIYGQRTADNRLAFGGRGAPYHFGSVIEPRFDQHEGVFAALEHTLHELFPDLDAEVTHRWGGPLAMPRDREPSVLVDHQRGLASSTGYTGDGVTLSRVCAEAIADMITTPDVETAATRLPFVQRTSRRWEVEPFRWLGINAGLTLATYADHVENTTGREGWPTRALNRLLG
jgi:glycine/D-amino acid oxidase-like deaminating enzyme